MIVPGLWQGSAPPEGPWVREAGFTTLVLCAMEYQPRVLLPFPCVETVYAPNDDSGGPLTREQLELAERAARIVAQRLRQRGKVLVTCMQGRNRSGLVSALALHKLLGVSGRRAMHIVQEARRGALVNPQFCDVLAQLPRPARVA
jgi:hypothetical protein